jgi:tetratricopeptide (TPR) repeat protein
MSFHRAQTSLQKGEGTWLRGAPGSGRTHALGQLAREWSGDVVWVRDAVPAWLSSLPHTVLVVWDDAPVGLSRHDLPASLPVVAAGPSPGAGWTIVDLPTLYEDSSIALFLQHAPGAGPLSAVRSLVRQLDGHPTAIVAAARRWPEAPLEALLVESAAAWSGLEVAWNALPANARATLALLAHLPGPVRHEGLQHCGLIAGLGPLLGAGWARITTPGTISVSRAVAAAVDPWQVADTAPYLAWFAAEARRRIKHWDQHGGARAWFRCGLWPTFAAHPTYSAEPELYRGWSLAGETPAELLSALAAQAATLDPLLSARCAARAHQDLGQRQEAVDVLHTALDATPQSGTLDHAFARLELGVAHHRLRELDDAFEAYTAALEQFSGEAGTRGRMLAASNLAAIDHDRGRLLAARDGYTTAIAEARSAGARRLQGIFCSNLGALLMELDDPTAARSTLRQAAQCLHDEPDDRFLAIARVNLAAVELLDGHLDAADAHYAGAIELLGEQDPSSRAMCEARRGAVAALRGDLDAARRHHQAADLLTPDGDPLTQRIVELWRSFLEWQAGDRASALARRREALTGTPSLVQTSDEARLVVRLLERAVGEPGAALLVGPEGAWARVPGKERVDIARYAASARILEGLARRAESAPGESCDADTLIEAGWPGEQILPDAAKNRLGVALARLRKLGLREQIQTTKDGWRLDPDWSVVLLRSEAPDPT